MNFRGNFGYNASQFPFRYVGIPVPSMADPVSGLASNIVVCVQPPLPDFFFSREGAAVYTGYKHGRLKLTIFHLSVFKQHLRKKNIRFSPKV